MKLNQVKSRAQAWEDQYFGPIIAVVLIAMGTLLALNVSSFFISPKTIERVIEKSASPSFNEGFKAGFRGVK